MIDKGLAKAPQKGQFVDPSLTERIRKAAEVFRAHGAREVYVFGSAADGRLREGSDIDLAVEGLPPELFFKALAEASDAVGRPIDLIDLDVDHPFTRFLRHRGRLHRVA